MRRVRAPRVSPDDGVVEVRVQGRIGVEDKAGVVEIAGRRESGESEEIGEGFLGFSASEAGFENVSVKLKSLGHGGDFHDRA